MIPNSADEAGESSGFQPFSTSLDDDVVSALREMLKRGDTERAIDRARKLPRGMVNDAMCGIANLLALNGDTDRAFAIVDAIDEQFGCEEHFDLAERLFNWGRNKEARTILEHLIDKLRHQSADGQPDPQQMDMIAITAFQRGEYELAIRAAESATGCDMRGAAELVAEATTELAKRGGLEQALCLIGELSYPLPTVALAALGQLRAAEGRWEEADDFFNKSYDAVEEDPWEVGAWPSVRKAESLSFAGRLDEAYSLLVESLEFATLMTEGSLVNQLEIIIDGMANCVANGSSFYAETCKCADRNLTAESAKPGSKYAIITGMALAELLESAAAHERAFSESSASDDELKINQLLEDCCFTAVALAHLGERTPAQSLFGVAFDRAFASSDLDLARKVAENFQYVDITLGLTVLSEWISDPRRKHDVLERIDRVRTGPRVG